MPRSGITYAQVAQVCNNLTAQGKSPTVDKVREILGTGSRTTINEHKKRWESRNETLLDNPEGIGINVLTLVQELSEQLANEASETIETKVSATEKRMGAEIQKKDMQLNEAAKRIDLLETRLDQACKELEKLHQQFEECAQKLEHEQKARVQAQTQLVEAEEKAALQQARIDSLEEKHSQSRRALEHYQNAVAEQREQEQIRYDQERAVLSQELKNVKDELAQKNEQISQLNHQCGTLVTEKKSLTQRIVEKENHNRDQAGQLAHLQTNIQDRQARYDAQTEKLLSLSTDNMQISREFTDSERARQVLRDENNHLSALVSHLQRKITELTREKPKCDRTG